MKLRVSYQRAAERTDVEITADGTVRAAELASTLVGADPMRPFDPNSPTTLALVVGPRVVPIPAEQLLTDSAVLSGTTITVVARPDSSQGPPATAVAVLRVLEGPDAGSEFPLRLGGNTIGRSESCDITLTDALVSKQHARITVTDIVEISDTNSSNGVVVDGMAIGRAVLRPSERALLGDSLVSVLLTAAPPPGAGVDGSNSSEFVRPPRIEPHFEVETHKIPDPPKAPQSQRFPLIALVTPVVLGAVLFAVTRSATSLLFVALSPVMMVGQWVESKWSGRKLGAQELKRFHQELDLLGDLVQTRQQVEAATRNAEAPPLDVVAEAVSTRTDLLWSRRPERPGYLVVSFGTATQPSRVQIDTANRQHAGPGEPAVLALIEKSAMVEGVPVVADLRECGSVGVAGAGEHGAAVSRGLVLQLAALHSPADLTIAACVGAASAPRWDWLKWLPHTTSTHSPLDVELLTAGLGPAASLIGALEDLVAQRESNDKRDSTPTVLLVIEDDAVVDRARLVGLAEHGGPVGVHVVWCAEDLARLPGACRAFISSVGGQWQAGFVDEAERHLPLAVAAIGLADTTAAARSLAPVVDSGARADDSSDLPRAVPYLSLAGTELAENPAAVLDRWVEADSLNARRIPGRRRSPATLRALIGQAATGPLVLDLRSEGPHALVGGTTGSGKSELLQTWALSLAASHSPERVTFLFVDYKGGAAFGECVNLPHTVGLVTDLSPHLVRRALVSLEAELKYREHLLNAAKAKDLAEMERLGHEQTPPSLVIVVDEFAALATEIPEFVDGVVNVAQRGRSLGLHLILATQRPAGVIKDNLRANTNLRLALRMADEADSTDVLGIADAAAFDPTAPGRAAVKSGHSRLVPFQSAYVGGYTAKEAPAPEIGIRVLGLLEVPEWKLPEPEVQPLMQTGPTDLQRLVSTIQLAASSAEVPPVRKPWLPELDAVIDLSTLPTERRDQRLVFARQDSPETQSQPVATFEPDRDGNLVVFGTSGAGKSTLLRSIAVAAGFTVRGGPVHVYGLDFGSRGLHMLEALPHVGSIVSGDDGELVQRLLRMLRRTIDERATSFAVAQAADITDFRARSGQAELPRILLLLDGLSAFRQTYDIGAIDGIFDLLASIAADGRAVGIHVLLTADRPASMPSSLGSLVPRRVVMRSADDNDLAMLGVPKDLFTLASPPGRGYLDGHELQVAILGGDPSTAMQARALDRLAGAIRRNSTWPDAPEIKRLPDYVPLNNLPIAVGDEPALGLEDMSLAPIGFPATGTFVIAGPPLSGRTSTARAMLASLARSPEPRLSALFGIPGSALALGPWDVAAYSPEAAAGLAEALQSRLKDEPDRQWVIVVESPADLLNTNADVPLQDLVKLARLSGSLVVAEGDTGTLTGSWPLLQALRFSRRGIVLQPEQVDGDMLFRTQFPRLRRADFPPGRGLLVREGRTYKVQVATP